MEKRILLFSPPFGDYTYPYHSLSYLKPVLERAGYRTIVLDLNIEWFRHLFNKSTIAEWDRQLELEFKEINSKPRLTLKEQRHLVRIVRSIAITRQLDPEAAVEILQGKSFYDYGAYLSAQNCVRNFERLLEHVFPVYPFYTAFAVPPGEPNLLDMITGALGSESLISSFRAVLRKKLQDDRFLFAGVSAPFYGNLRLGFAALEAVRREFPGTRTVAGGTAVTDMVKNAEFDTTLQPLSKLCDFLVVGEAERSVVQLASWLSSGAGNLPQGVIDVSKPVDIPQVTKMKYVDLDSSGVDPDHTWVPWDLYLSPERQVNYSPTRGCFWNKCTFCDYGLNEDLPTAPYRMLSAIRAVEYIGKLKELEIGHVYLSIDAISPGLLRGIASGLIERKIETCLSAELFLTRHFDPGFVSLLEQAGLVTASFGLESGSSRVLELMGKGAGRVEKVYRPAMSAFRGSSIGLQPKFFFGFPGETDQERQETVSFLNHYRDVLSIVTQGNVFDLTAGSIVAKHPSDFGLANLRRKSNQDMNGARDYDLVSGQAQPKPRDFARFNSQLSRLGCFERPWAGGIDSFHTKLYIRHFGRDVFHKLLIQYADKEDVTRPWVMMSHGSRYDLNEVFERALVASAFEQECTIETISQQVSLADIIAELDEINCPLEPLASEQRFDIRFC